MIVIVQLRRLIVSSSGTYPGTTRVPHTGPAAAAPTPYSDPRSGSWKSGGDPHHHCPRQCHRHCQSSKHGGSQHHLLHVLCPLQPRVLNSLNQQFLEECCEVCIYIYLTCLFRRDIRNVSEELCKEGLNTAPEMSSEPEPVLWQRGGGAVGGHLTTLMLTS